MNWNVVSVEALAPLQLAVRFQDGTQGTVRFEAAISVASLPR